MKRKTRLILFLSLLAGLLTCCFSTFVIATDPIPTLLPSPIPTIEPLNPETLIFKEFRSISGLRVKYPEKAMIVDVNSLESQIPKDVLLKRQLKILFLVCDSKKFFQLIVQEEEFDSNLSVTQINNELKKDDKLRGIEDQVVVLKNDNQSMLLDVDNVINGALFKTKRKIICRKTAGQAKMKVYTISFFTTPDQYSYYKLVMTKIIEEAGVD